jgi:hypothetical protein
MRMRQRYAFKIAGEYGALPPELGKDFFVCSESLGRDVEKLCRLDDRIAKRKRSNAADWTHEDAPDATEDDEHAPTH